MAIINAGSRLLAAVLSPGPWIPVTFQNAWSNTGGVNVTAQYRLWQLLNSVEIVGDVSHASFSGSSTPFTLPSSPVNYVPASQQSWPLGFYACTAGFANAASPPLVTVTTGGAVTVGGAPAGTTRIQFLPGMLVSLDA
jgi:hypothetical protein